MQSIPEGRRLPFAIAVAAAIVVVVVAVVLLGQPGPGPGPTASPSTPAPSASPTEPTSTPEGAVRAFFEAFGEAGETDDAEIVLPFVTSEDAPAYLSAFGYLEGQKAVNRGSVVTAQRFDDVEVSIDGDTAEVTFSYVESGYPIELDTGEPLASPTTYAPVTIIATVQQVDAQWLVHAYESGR
jgi:hypothetical protein